MAAAELLVELRNDRGLLYSLPADLNCISTYSLLEQEGWFEKEVDFVWRMATPEMTAMDIGANVGCYTLPLAQLLGPRGKVIAYEPGGENRRHLERSLRMNDLRNVEVCATALSDFSGTGMLHVAISGELNRLVADCAAGDHVETIAVSTLDDELERLALTRLDFIKIDAEGHETAIIRGGRRLFDRFSPLVMFELKHGSVINRELVSLFASLGFDCYRLLGDGSMLVPVGPLDELDDFELNLFAARPDRARQLGATGLLARTGADAMLSAMELEAAMARYCELPFARAMEIGIADIADCAWSGPLVAYAAYRFLDDLAPDRKFALLQFAHDDLLCYCNEVDSSCALATLACITYDLGARRRATAILDYMDGMESHALVAPFFPPSRHHEQIGSVSAEVWFADSILEASERWLAWSSAFLHNPGRLERLIANRYASAEISRRLLLSRAKQGRLGAGRPAIDTGTGRIEIPHDPDWLALVRSIASEA